jgi:hypothetical protein
MGILSLKRLVLHHYDQFNLILGEKYEQELDYLQFNDDTDMTYRENSTDGESTKSYEKQFDVDGHVLQKVKELVAVGDDIKEYKDWKDLLLHDRVKRILVSFFFFYYIHHLQVLHQ